MAARRLALQEAAEELAQAAVSPPARGQLSGTQAAISLPEVTSPSIATQAEQGEKFAHMQPDPPATGQVKAVASQERAGGQEIIGEDSEDQTEETNTDPAASEEIKVPHSQSAGALNPTVGLTDGAGTHSLLKSSEKARKRARGWTRIGSEYDRSSADDSQEERERIISTIDRGIGSAAQGSGACTSTSNKSPDGRSGVNGSTCASPGHHTGYW
uniref:Uncharacterized protein n=1 Tax=Peronospora matthiolae TaxID=2874970 RepID=A0AAV1UJ10_9STRA